MSDDLHDFFEEHSSWDDQEEHLGPEPPVPPSSRKAMRKARKKKKNKRKKMVALLVSIALVLGGGGWYMAGKIRQWRSANLSTEAVVEDYPGPGDGEVTFTILKGEGAMEVADKLLKDEVIKSTSAFTSFVAANDITLYPGSYELKKHMKASDVANYLSDPQNAHGIVDVRAGERLKAVIQNAAQASSLPEDDFYKIIDSKEEAGKILPSEANGKFEGWFEPGAYNVSDCKSAQEILKRMVDARIEKLNQLGVPGGENRERVLIVASIVEAEVNSPDYYGKVSRVIENRLKKDMTLGMDSTVAYGFDTTGTELTNDQLNDGSNPYNTRVNKGLPPTPISNPGDNAIEAALHPEDGDWLYFVTVNLKTGETKFTDSDEEFQKLVEEYKNNNPDAN